MKMTGKRYYITTLGAWQRHAGRFANSHWLALGGETATEDSDSRSFPAPESTVTAAYAQTSAGAASCAPTESSLEKPTSVSDNLVADDATPIIVLVEADEGPHLALEDDAAFEALPHPLAQKPISQAARDALASHDVPYGATTFDVAEAVGRAHPLLRHRVF
jgi:hypothetical protein